MAGFYMKRKLGSNWLNWQNRFQAKYFTKPLIVKHKTSRETFILALTNKQDNFKAEKYCLQNLIDSPLRKIIGYWN